jgi:hypothetical protein
MTLHIFQNLGIESHDTGLSRMEKQPPKRRPGRPALGKRGNFTFRVREALREQLIAAAEAQKLSVSEEIERRLEASFTTIGAVSEMFGGKENAQLLFAFGVAIQELERVIGKPWWTDQSTCEALQGAVDLILQSLKARLPEGWKPTEGVKYYPPLADLASRDGGDARGSRRPRSAMRRVRDRKFIDYFQIGDVAALTAMKAQLAARNAPAKAPEPTPPSSTPSSRKAKR